MESEGISITQSDTALHKVLKNNWVVGMFFISIRFSKISKIRKMVLIKPFKKLLMQLILVVL